MFIFSEQDAHVKVLWSLNLGNAHWATVEVQINKQGNDFNCDVFYYDPEYAKVSHVGSGSNKLSDQHFAAIEPALRSGIQRIVTHANVKSVINCANPYPVARQPLRDTVSCVLSAAKTNLRVYMVNPYCRICGMMNHQHMPFWKLNYEIIEILPDFFATVVAAATFTIGIFAGATFSDSVEMAVFTTSLTRARQAVVRGDHEMANLCLGLALLNAVLLVENYRINNYPVGYEQTGDPNP